MNTDNKYSFDSKCYDLAEHFYPSATKNQLDDLAQRIQDVVEAEDLEAPLPPCPKCGEEVPCPPCERDDAPTSSQFQLGKPPSKPIVAC